MMLIVIPTAYADDDSINEDLANLGINIMIGICSEHQTCSGILFIIAIISVIILLIGCIIGGCQFDMPSMCDISIAIIGGMIGKGIGKKMNK